MRILAIGLGGAGSRMVDKLYFADRRNKNSKIQCVDAIAIDVDQKTLKNLKYLPESSRLFFPSFDQLFQKNGVSHIDIEEVIAKVQTMEHGENDAIVICMGLGGNLADIAPLIISDLRKSVVEPLFGLITLPCVGEGDKKSAKAADAVEKLQPILDGIILFDNETWFKKIKANLSRIKDKKGLRFGFGSRKKTREEEKFEMYDLLNDAIVRRFVLILRAGEFTTEGGLDLAAEVVLDSGEVLNTIKGMGFITIGYAVEHLPRNPLNFFSKFQAASAIFDDDHHKKASRIVDLAKNAIYHEISAPCDMTSAEKALILIAGPSHELSMKGFMTVRKWIDRSISGIEMRSGDYPVANTSIVAIIIMLAGLHNIPRLEEINEIRNRYYEECAHEHIPSQKRRISESESMISVPAKIKTSVTHGSRPQIQESLTGNEIASESWIDAESGEDFEESYGENKISGQKTASLKIHSTGNQVESVNDKIPVSVEIPDQQLADIGEFRKDSEIPTDSESIPKSMDLFEDAALKSPEVSLEQNIEKSGYESRISTDSTDTPTIPEDSGLLNETPLPSVPDPILKHDADTSEIHQHIVIKPVKLQRSDTINSQQISTGKSRHIPSADPRKITNSFVKKDEEISGKKSNLDILDKNKGAPQSSQQEIPKEKVPRSTGHRILIRSEMKSPVRAQSITPEKKDIRDVPSVSKNPFDHIQSNERSSIYEKGASVGKTHTTPRNSFVQKIKSSDDNLLLRKEHVSEGNKEIEKNNKSLNPIPETSDRKGTSHSGMLISSTDSVKKLYDTKSEPRKISSQDISAPARYQSDPLQISRNKPAARRPEPILKSGLKPLDPHLFPLENGRENNSPVQKKKEKSDNLKNDNK